MSTTQPIRQLCQLREFENYYQKDHPNPRNYALIIFGLNTALRISDILKTTWDMVYDFDTAKYRPHLQVKEQKTGKNTMIALNRSVISALNALKTADTTREQYLFPSQKHRNLPISRYQAFRIIKKAAIDTNLPDHVSCHSLRKTFGYHAWKNGTPPALLMDIFNHSSYQITKRYLCIEQDERDQVFFHINL